MIIVTVLEILKNIKNPRSRKTCCQIGQQDDMGQGAKNKIRVVQYCVRVNYD